MRKEAHNSAHLEGQKFGKLIVIGLSEKREFKNRHWDCLCECGNLTIVSSTLLICGKTKSCGCWNKGKKAPNSKEYKGLSGVYWAHVKESAKGRGIEILISLEEAADLLEEQNYKCAFSGIELTLKKYIGKSDNKRDIWTEQTASLDRKDSSKPYTKENCQWIHKKFQRLKNNLLDEDFFDMCREVINFIDSKKESDKYAYNAL